MLQQMTVIRKHADRIRIAEIHSQANARIRQRPSVEVRHIDGIAKEILSNILPHVLEKQKMQLMYMERV